MTANAASVGHAGTVQRHVAKTLQLTQLVHKSLPHNAGVHSDRGLISDLPLLALRSVTLHSPTSAYTTDLQVTPPRRDNERVTRDSES